MKNHGFRKFFAVAASEGEATPTFTQQLQGFALTHAFQTNPCHRRSHRLAVVRWHGPSWILLPTPKPPRWGSVPYSPSTRSLGAPSAMSPIRCQGTSTGGSLRREPELQAAPSTRSVSATASAFGIRFTGRNAAFLPWSGHKTRKGGNPQ